MFKNIESKDFTTTVIFYLMILQLLNNNNTSNNSTELFELVEYFKKRNKIAIDFSAKKKLLVLFNKYKTLLLTIKIKNKSQIIKSISRLIGTYSGVKLNKDFTINFYNKLKKMANKIILSKSRISSKNMYKTIITLLTTSTIRFKKSWNFTTKILKFNTKHFKKLFKESKGDINKNNILMHNTYKITTCPLHENHLNKNVNNVSNDNINNINKPKVGENNDINVNKTTDIDINSISTKNKDKNVAAKDITKDKLKVKNKAYNARQNDLEMAINEISEVCDKYKKKKLLCDIVFD